MLLQDARDYQILFLSFFLFLGIGTRDWTLRPELIVTLIATCLIVQGLGVLVVRQLDRSLSNFTWESSWRSALITGLGLSLLLRADNYLTMVLAGTLAIGSKFVLQVERKHFFNPGNFGIIAALVLTGDAWVSPGQWGDEWLYLFIFAGTGAMVLKKVGRWDTSAAFLISYALLEAMRNWWLGWTWDVWAHRLSSGSLWLFALFMITDPRSIPNSQNGRIVWAVAIAILAFILRNLFFVPTAVFWALFAIAPLTIIIDRFWIAPNFSWFSKTQKNLVAARLTESKI